MLLEVAEALAEATNKTTIVIKQCDLPYVNGASRMVKRERINDN